jgi:DNA polymerase III gamma/tau subunit
MTDNHFYTDCKIINCSDKTGVDYIRKNIIEVVQRKPRGSFWFYIMEESDELSRQAQNALRKPMEHPFDEHVRFIFLCNDITKMKPAILDRCRVFQYMPIAPEEMVPRLEYIATEEKIDISKELLLKLAECSNGSMRYPVLQLEEFKALNRKIVINDIQLEKSLDTIREIFELLDKRKIPMAKNKIMDLYQEGNMFDDIIRYFHDFTMFSLKNNTNFRIKGKTLIKIAETERSVKEGCNQFIALSFLLSHIALLLDKIKKKP